MKNLFLFALIVLVFPGCTKSGAPSVEKIILISVDALRPDFLGCYNPSMKTSPHIDRFAAENIVCTDVMAQASSTAMSHKSIFYSLYPSIHKTSKDSVPIEKMESPIEILRDSGFHTAAFVGGGQMGSKFGFSRGFQSYWEPPALTEATKHDLKEMERRSRQWLKKNQKNKFFLVLHTYEVHCPYQPPESYIQQFAGWYRGEIDPKGKCGDTFYNKRNMTEEDLRFVRDLYAAEVKVIDDFFGRLVGYLKELGIYDQTLIVFLSDHGESLGERGYIGHNQLYDVQLKIPLILKIPGMGPARLTTPLESLDVMPTLFDAAGIRRRFPFQGKNLIPFLNGRSQLPAERIRMAEQSGRVCIRNGKWTLIFSPSGDQGPELYFDRDDPEQKSNLALEYGSVAEEMEQHYYRLLDNNQHLISKFVVDPSARPQLDEQTREELKALGYVGN